MSKAEEFKRRYNVDAGGLAQLLIRKGVITDDEYLEVLAETMEAEQASYEAELSQLIRGHGSCLPSKKTNIKLG